MSVLSRLVLLRMSRVLYPDHCNPGIVLLLTTATYPDLSTWCQDRREIFFPRKHHAQSFWVPWSSCQTCIFAPNQTLRKCPCKKSIWSTFTWSPLGALNEFTALQKPGFLNKRKVWAIISQSKINHQSIWTHALPLKIMEFSAQSLLKFLFHFSNIFTIKAIKIKKKLEN